jgi:hypothetical protein
LELDEPVPLDWGLAVDGLLAYLTCSPMPCRVRLTRSAL